MIRRLAALFAPTEIAGVAAAGVCVAAAITLAIRAYLRSRPTLAELERRRRRDIHRRGKLGDGMILEVNDDVILYSYDVGGIRYTASQDVASLDGVVGQELWRVIGPASVKYDPRNPANSIVVCEEWTGLRDRTKL